MPMIRFAKTVSDILTSKQVLLFIALLTLYCYSINAAAKNDADASPSVAPNQNHIQGSAFLQRGQFNQAVAELSESVAQLAKSGEDVQEIRARLKLSRAQQGLGEYADAKVNLERARKISETINDDDLKSLVIGALGNVHLVVGPISIAEALLHEATDIARSEHIKAVAQNNLGNHYAIILNNRLALAAYRRAAQLADQSRKKMLTARALANVARLTLTTNEPVYARAVVEKSVDLLSELPGSHDKAFVLINMSRTLSSLDSDFPQPGHADRLRALQLLNQAEKIARKINDNAALSYALGYRAALYEKEQRYDEVLTLTQQAIFFAQQLGEHDSKMLLGLWDWQTGRALAKKNQPVKAIDAYARAVKHFGALRYAMQYAYGQQVSGFGTTLNPVYQEFIELLFQAADLTEEAEYKHELLRKVRDTVEDLKAAELRDYFQDSCVDDLQAKSRDIGKISSSALIVYPIVLQDRLELLLHLPGGEVINQPVAVSKNELTEAVNAWRILLETPSNQHRKIGKKLYQWLVKPYESRLTQWQVDTLVFVPDAELRQVPMAALWDAENKQFLIEKYPVAITPGVNLTDPKTIDRNKVKPLYAGISEAIHDFPALPYVNTEIDHATTVFKGKVLLNNTFTNKGLSSHLKDQSINVLHLATHGEFNRSAKQSFILTYDGKRNLSELANDIATFKFRDTPLDLLVLSACETARGDNRAALGLSGIAIKAGARSALGTLWKVKDEAAALLMQEFYTALRKPGISRAKALQNAQQALMQKREKISGASFRYPAYWSPFIMINSWL